MPRPKRDPPTRAEPRPLPSPVYPMAWLMNATDQAWTRICYGLRCAECEHETIVQGDTPDEAWREIHKLLAGWQVLWTSAGGQLFCPRCAEVFIAQGYVVYQSF